MTLMNHLSSSAIFHLECFVFKHLIRIKFECTHGVQKIVREIKIKAHKKILIVIPLAYQRMPGKAELGSTGISLVLDTLVVPQSHPILSTGKLLLIYC